MGCRAARGYSADSMQACAPVARHFEVGVIKEVTKVDAEPKELNPILRGEANSSHMRPPYDSTPRKQREAAWPDHSLLG